MQKALSSKPSVKERSLPWLKLSPGNARVKQPGSCTQIQLLREWLLTVPLATAWRFLHLAPYVTSGLKLFTSCTLLIYADDISAEFFCNVLYMGLHFRAILKTPLLQKILSIKWHFSDSACFSRSMIYCSGSTLPSDTWCFCLNTKELENLELLSPFPTAITEVTLVASLLPKPWGARVKHS